MRHGLLFLLSLASVSAQAPAPSAVPVHEIPDRLQQGAALVRRARSDAAPQESIQASEMNLPLFREGLKGLAGVTRRILREELTPAANREVRNIWTSIGERLSGWQGELKQRGGALQKDLNELEREAEVLRLTEEAAASQQIPAEMSAALRRTAGEMAATKQAVLARRNVVLKLQSEVSLLQTEVAVVDEQLEADLAAERGMLLRLDGKPIWEGAPARFPAEAAAIPIPSTKGTTEVIRSYLAHILRFLGEVLALFVLLLAVLLAVKPKAARFAVDEDKAGRGVTLLARRPVSVALLLALLAGTLFFSHAPQYLISLGTYVLLVPIYRLAPGLTAPGLRRFLLALGALLVGNGALAFLPQYAIPTRLLVLGLAAATVVGLVLYGRRVESWGPLNAWRAAARWGVRAGLVLVVAAFGCEVAGATNLGRFLLSGVLSSAISAAVLFVALLVLEGLVHLVLQGPAKPEGSLWEMPDEGRRQLAKGMRWLTVIAFLVIVLHAFELWDPLAKGVEAALRFEVALGAIRFTLGAGVTFALVLLAAALISRLLRFFLTAGLEERLAWQRGKSEAISKIVHYAILTGGFFVALGASGIDLTKVTIVVGAIGVGVGLGLQNVINNFVSGLILLFERPLHVGDKVTVGATSGEVSDIGIRASTIRTWDGADVVIPNGNLISGEFTNWTLTDDKRRSEIRVGVAYGVEPQRVREILKGAAGGHPLVLFSGFGESSLDFVLYFWTLLADSQRATSEIHGAVYDRLKAEGIEIPFPQREVLLKRPMGE